jgi:GNAT superfamily N-acetyltransferase
MRVSSLDDAVTFEAAAAPLLQRDPAGNNLPLGIVQSLLDRPDIYPEAFFWIVEHEGSVVGAALRTPPYPLVLADPIDPGVVEALVTSLVDAGTSPRGVTANEPWASRFAGAWTAATGVSWRVSIGQGVFRLTSVQPPRPTPGAAREATTDDRALLVRWMHEFETEALQAMIRDEHAADRAVEARLSDDGAAGFAIWEDDGRPVSLTGWMRIPGGARVGPVYTPPGERGHGYASKVVADVSARMLEQGASACFLYTDLGNPTSNSIYRQIGYEQIAESLMITFDDPS